MAASSEVFWCPSQENVFARLTNETNLTLYQVENYCDRPPTAQSIPLSCYTHASPTVSTIAPFYVRCLSWCPTLEFGHLLVAGSAIGRVSIIGFQQEPRGGRDSFRSLQNKEFTPRHQRNCNAVHWSPTDCNLIAVGLDRHRNDPSLMVYDVFSSSKDYVSGEKGKDDVVNGEVRGALELGAGEHVASCSWFPGSSKNLLGGFHGRGLRVFDIRDPTKPRGNVTKHVFGACIDPFGEHRVASFADNQLSIWDLRNFEKPIASHEAIKPITQVGWSPTRYGLVSLTIRDSPDFRLLDVQHAHVNHDEYEPVILERNINVTDGKTISSFCWHPKHENRVLISTPSSMHDLRVHERMTLNWSKTHHLLWACGPQMHYFTDQTAPDPVVAAINEDISVRMKIRATTRYGMETVKFADNVLLLAGDPEPEQIWNWLDYIRTTEGLDPMDGISFRGIRNILLSKSRTEITYAVWDGPQGREGVPVYSNTDRDHVLRLCGWSVNKETTIDNLINEEEYERAAALCVFHFSLGRAVDILRTAAKYSKSEKNYSIIAVALSGFTEDQPSLWRSLCSTITTEISDPYVRSIFLFLSSSRSEATQKRILQDAELAFEDRIAFASTFLSDPRLLEYIKELTEEMISRGLLEGLALAGFGTEGIDLVQNYVDSSGDVQTASLLTSQVTTREWSEDPRPHHWVDDYREVLDSWMLWDARATFDVHNSRLKGGGPRVPRQVVATCTFCGKAVSHTSGTQSFSARGEKLFAKTPNVSEIPKVMTCSSCGKTLPRCALCQINMGTPTNMGFVTGEPDEESVKKATKINPIEKWFTWCQSCRHGGHAAHLAEWFKDHSECAVTGCSCKCMMIESGCATVTNNRRRVATSN